MIITIPILLMTVCFLKIYIEIDKIQYGINKAYYGPIYLQENTVWVCRGYSALVAGLTKLLFKTSDMVNFLYSSIINY